MSQTDNHYVNNGSILLKALFVGVFLGLSAFIIALLFGTSFLNALIYYGFFGFFGMLLIIIKDVFFPAKKKPDTTTSVNSVSHQS